jgi:excisionase family DNA binding protein
MQTTRIIRLTILTDFTRQETYDFTDPINFRNTLGKNEYLLTPEQRKTCRYSMDRLEPIISPAGVLKVREPLHTGDVLLIAIPRGQRLADIVIDPSTALDFMLDPRDKRKKSSDIVSDNSESPGLHVDLKGLIYLFAIGKDGVFDVTAKVIKDEDDFYTKLKANLDDVPMREYLVQRSLAGSKVTMEYVERVRDRMTVEEAAEYLRMPKSTLEDKIATRKIKSFKSGRRNIIMREDADAYLHRRGNK